MFTPSSLIRSNIYSANTAISIINFRHNRSIITASSQLEKIDPISDFELFKKEVITFKKKLARESWLGVNQIGGDSALYGHLNALQEYSNIYPNRKHYLYFPYMEHGISWLNEPLSADSNPYNHNIVSQGGYRHSAIRNARTIPHYIVGPYIHYANSLLPEYITSSLKAKLGKTLLVIPAHTYEDSKAEYGRIQYVEGLFKTVAPAFNSVIVSAYWNDVDDEIFDLFKSFGAYVVSSGFRNDPHFISRLKSLLILSDAVTGNALGTHIGYSLYMKKPYIHFDGSARVSITEPFSYVEIDQKEGVKTRTEILDKVRTIFSITPGIKNDNMQHSFYKTYWGGTKAIKTPEEIAAIFAICKDMLEQSRGRISTFEKTYGELLSEYPENSLKHKLLSEALQ